MPTFDESLLLELLDDQYKIAVETGTFEGKRAKLLKSKFEHVYTIEIDKKLYNLFSPALIKLGILPIHGNSHEMINSIMYILNDLNYKILFWLDAHWSGDNTVDWKNSKWKGFTTPRNTGYIPIKNIEDHSENQVPLKEEILTIYNNINNECILYIDDFHNIDPITLKGMKNKNFIGENWTCLDFNEIFNIVEDRIIYKKITKYQCILKFRSM